MCLSFLNILIPVDFTINTEFAIKNAQVLADPANAVIHLFHVENKAPHERPDTYSISNEIKLLQIKEKIHESSEMIRVEIHLVSGGTVQSRIIKKAIELKSDLIIIGKHNYNNWLTFLNTTNSSIIAKKTNCAVLNIRMGTVLNKIRSVVMPIRSFVPIRKMELLPALTRKQRPIIHLITVQDLQGRAVDTKVFTDTYRNLSRDLHYPVNHKMITGNNYAKKIMKYAMDVEADIIMVNPFDETAISSFWGMHFNDMPYLKFNVLTVSPLPIQKVNTH
jgi:nucleotide-binding universal stress UspA family protein